jgi:hypothetical protein
MRVILKLLMTVAAGVALGLLSVWLALGRGAPLGGDVRDGPWSTSLATGSTQSGAMARASVALHGLLALNRSETIYYSATADDAGGALDARCAYRVTGRDPPARWWSITAYGADDYLIPNAAHLYSVSKNSVRRDADGSFTVTVARNAAGPNAIASGSGAFSLTLRLYNPDAAVAADPAHVALPRIEKGSCS